MFLFLCAQPLTLMMSCISLEVSSVVVHRATISSHKVGSNKYVLLPGDASNEPHICLDIGND